MQFVRLKVRREVFVCIEKEPVLAIIAKYLVDRIVIEESQTAPVDLIAGTITVPANAISGQEATIVYTIQNAGPFAAIGPWSDALYLSTDDVWDINDTLIGRITHKEDLAAGDCQQDLRGGGRIQQHHL